MTSHGEDALEASQPTLGGPRGEALAFLAMLKASDIGQPAEVVAVARGEVVGQPWPGISDLRFDPAGERLAYVGWGKVSMAPPQLGFPPEMPRPGLARYDCDPSMPSLWIAVKELEHFGDCVVCVDGEPVSAPFPRIAAPAWSPDGARLAFIAQTEDGLHLVLDDWRSPAFERLGDPVFLDDGRLACAAYADGQLWWKVFQPTAK